MSKDSLSESEISVFFARLGEYLRTQEFLLESQNIQEREITATTVGPALKQFVSGLLIPQMMVRYDGDLASKPLLRNGMSFFPDAQVSLNLQKVLSVEVKIIRDQDPSGSLSKAIGQAIIYRELGFECSIGLIFDFRKNRHDSLVDTLNSIGNKQSRVNFFLFTSNPNWR